MFTIKYLFNLQAKAPEMKELEANKKSWKSEPATLKTKLGRSKSIVDPKKKHRIVADRPNREPHELSQWAREKAGKQPAHIL